MTSRYSGAILHCETQTVRQAVSMFAGVSMVETVITEEGEALLVAFEQPIRVDHFEDGLEHGMRALRSVTKVVPIPDRWESVGTMEQIMRITDFVATLKPVNEGVMSASEIEAHVDRLRGWAKVRAAVSKACHDLVVPPRRQN